MTSKATRIRNHLDSLWETVLSDTMSENLKANAAVSFNFLKEHKIQLVSHDFETSGLYGYCHPPVLFEICPQSFLDRYPIEPESCDDPIFGNQVYKFHDYHPGGDSMNPRDCSRRVFNYLRDWAYTGFPRKDTEFIPLSNKRGIFHVRVPHGILLDETFTMTTRTMKWEADIYEYDVEFWEQQHPHVILLSYQSDIGHEKSIMHGELAQLITAMRNRAFEPEMMEVDDDEDVDYFKDEEVKEAFFPEGSPLVFPYEQRFPVLMVSMVGPQHGRIYYACMDGLDVVIRQSSLFSFEKREDAPWDLFARVLLSNPVQENERGELSVPPIK